MEIEYLRHPGAIAGSPPVGARAGDFVFLGGQIAVAPALRLPDEIKPPPGYAPYGSSIERQLRYIFGNIKSSLDSLGSSMNHVMKINSYHTQPSELDAALRVRREWFEAEDPPPSTLVIATETLVPSSSVAIDVTALATDSTRYRQAIHATNAPRIPHSRIFGWPVYSQAVRGGGFVFTAGVAMRHPDGIAPDPEMLPDPEFPYSRNRIRIVTERILEDLMSVLEGAGCSAPDVVRAEVYVDDAEHLAVLNEVWERFFPVDPPARVITPLPLSHGNVSKMLEVEFIAVDPDGPYRKETIFTKDAPTPRGPEPQATKAGPYVFFSTQMASDYTHGLAPEVREDPDFPFHSSSIKRQVEYIYGNVEAICKAAGTSATNLVKRRAAHLDLNEWTQAEEVWTAHLGDRLPPTTTFRAKAPLLVPGCAVQYELVAASE